MKKYQQLLLLVISIVSLGSLLVYRHQYNRLHYVLEVFDFFGSPCNFSDILTTNNVITNQDWGPTPLWQENDGSYIYSAFWNNSQAQVLALSQDAQKSFRNCYFWYEAQTKPVIGKLTYYQLSSPSEHAYTIYVYTCKAPENAHSPYAITITKNKQISKWKKVLLTNSHTTNVAFNSTICVTPTEALSKRNLLEFISYYKLLGVDSFIFYNANIPHRLVKLLSNLSTRLGYKITFLPWSFPIEDTELPRLVIEQDCYFRATHKSFNVINLEVDEYIVPTGHQSLFELMKDISGKNEKINLPVLTICIENSKQNVPIALQNTKVNRGTDSIVQSIYVNKNIDIRPSKHVDEGFASIHKYIVCSKNSHKNTYQDTSIMKYYSDFIHSTLVQLLIHGQI